MPRTSAVNMKCPRSEHAGSRVKLTVLTENPATDDSAIRACQEGAESRTCSPSFCRGRREGPGTARANTGSGSSSDAKDPRRLATTSSLPGESRRRFRCDTETGELRESSHGQLLADWVEVFAPVVFQPFRLTAWPTQGSLLLDHLPFRVRALDPSGRESPLARWLSMSSAASALSRASPSSGSQRRLQAPILPTGAPSWARCPAIPERIVCDGHGGMLAAIEARWPQAELHRCEWHLQHALDRLLAKEARNDPSEELRELRERAEGALVGPPSWHQFVRAARVAENESLDRWIAVNAATIEAQFARRALTPRRPDMPLTTAALEQITRPIVAALYPRRYAFKNRERLNRLLMLLQLYANGNDDVQAYARAIRLHLEANGGRPLAQRRAVTDPANSLSLR